MYHLYLYAYRCLLVADGFDLKVLWKILEKDLEKTLNLNVLERRTTYDWKLNAVHINDTTVTIIEVSTFHDGA